MQLYNSAFSPYASRCRIQIHHKQLPVEIIPPPGGLGSAQLKDKNAIGKIPVLDLGDKSLSESWAIMDYLETRYPQQTPMRPGDAFDAAKQQELVRFTDLQLATTMFPMFRALRGAAGPEAVAEALTGLKAQLQILETLLAQKNNSLPLDLADAALLPIAWYARVLVRHFGKSDCLEGLPVTQAWWQRTSSVPAAAKVLGEMEAGLRAAIPALFATA